MEEHFKKEQTNQQRYQNKLDQQNGSFSKGVMKRFKINFFVDKMSKIVIGSNFV